MVDGIQRRRHVGFGVGDAAPAQLGRVEGLQFRNLRGVGALVAVQIGEEGADPGVGFGRGHVLRRVGDQVAVEDAGAKRELQVLDAGTHTLGGGSAHIRRRILRQQRSAIVGFCEVVENELQLIRVRTQRAARVRRYTQPGCQRGVRGQVEDVVGTVEREMTTPGKRLQQLALFERILFDQMVSLENRCVGHAHHLIQESV